jgi:hypothetical protein
MVGWLAHHSIIDVVLSLSASFVGEALPLPWLILVRLVGRRELVHGCQVRGWSGIWNPSRLHLLREAVVGVVCGHLLYAWSAVLVDLLFSLHEIVEEAFNPTPSVLKTVWLLPFNVFDETCNTLTELYKDEWTVANYKIQILTYLFLFPNFLKCIRYIIHAVDVQWMHYFFDHWATIGNQRGTLTAQGRSFTPVRVEMWLTQNSVITSLPSFRKFGFQLDLKLVVWI